MPEPLLVRAPEAARMLGISQSTLWARAQTGRCPNPIRWDGTTVWRVSDLKEFVNSLADQMADQPNRDIGKHHKNMVLTG